MISPIRFYNSKSKTVLFCLVVAVFVSLGFIFVLNPVPFTPTVLQSTVYIQIIGVISVLFFGLSAYSIIGKNHLNKAVFEITEKGITNRHSVWRKPIFIEWKDVAKIEEKKILGSKYVAIYIDDVDAYLQKEKNVWFKLNYRLTTQLWKTPYILSTGLMNVSFRELKLILLQKFKEQKATFLDPIT